MASSPSLSVALPVFNEEANIGALHQRLVGVLASLDATFEVIYVDDGSSDRSRELLSELAKGDARVGVLVLSRNFGHQIALTAGLDHANGDAVILMDSDLQDPPELIPDLVARWKDAFDVVYARRRARQGESAFKRASAFAFYRFIRLVSTVDVPVDTGDFRLLSRRAADALRVLRERRRFLRGLVAWTGFRQTSVGYDRPRLGVSQESFDNLHHFLFRHDGELFTCNPPARLEEKSRRNRTGPFGIDDSNELVDVVGLLEVNGKIRPVLFEEGQELRIDVLRKVRRYRDHYQAAVPVGFLERDDLRELDDTRRAPSGPKV